MRRILQHVTFGLLTVCLSVCSAFTLPDQSFNDELTNSKVVRREKRSEQDLGANLRRLKKSRRNVDVELDKLDNILRVKRNEDTYKLKSLKESSYEEILKRFRRSERKLAQARAGENVLNRLDERQIHKNVLQRFTRNKGKVDLDLRSREGADEISRLISETGRADVSTITSAVLGSDSLNRKPAHSQHSRSQQVNNREVNSKHRHQLRDDSIHYRLLHERKLEESARIFHEKKLEGGHRVLRDEYSVYRDEGNKVGQSEALSQEVSKSDLAYSVPKMVVVATTTVATLFGMCVMAAIFQCCCRRKRASSDSEPVDGVKSGSSDKKSSKSPSPEKDISKPDGETEKTENDKLLEDEDLGDFSAVQRETEILKSFRKPPPPKNRARASRVPRMKAAASSEDAFSLIKEETDGSIKSKSSSRRSSPEKKDSTEVKPEETASPENSKKEEPISSNESPKDLIETPKVKDKRLSFEAAKQMVDSMLAEVKERGEATLAAAEPEVKPEKEKVKENETTNVNGVSSISMEGNIFAQIDPTVKIEDPCEKKTSRIPVRATPSSPSSAPKQGASLRPTSANKEQRKFLVPSVHGEQMDQLVKSLKTKLKEDKGQTCLSDRNLATSKPMSPGSDDGMEPVERERSHSDPTKKLLGIKSTHV